MAKKLAHKKIKNTGLLFEFMLRQITSDVLDNNEKSYALDILKKRFNEKTELGREQTLYGMLLTKKFNSDKKADFFINEVIRTRSTLNDSQLRREKYNLIRELKNKYDLQKLFSSKIPNYIVYASIYKLFEYKDRLSPEEKTESYFNLMESITSQDQIKLSETVGTKLPDDEDLRILTYRILLEKFNQKYSHLDSNQKGLLKAYINNVSNTNSLREYIGGQIPELKKNLRILCGKVDDKITRIKLKEAIRSIDTFCFPGQIVKDSSVIQLMRYFQLVKELKNHD